MNRTQRYSYYEADARERIASLVDAGSFREFLGPARRMMSPHLAQLDQPAAFDDGIVVGEATLRGRRVLLAAQPELVTPVLHVVQRVLTRHLLDEPHRESRRPIGLS